MLFSWLLDFDSIEREKRRLRKEPIKYAWSYLKRTEFQWTTNQPTSSFSATVLFLLSPNQHTLRDQEYKHNFLRKKRGKRQTLHLASLFSLPNIILLPWHACIRIWKKWWFHPKKRNDIMRPRSRSFHNNNDNNNSVDYTYIWCVLYRKIFLISSSSLIKNILHIIIHPMYIREMANMNEILCIVWPTAQFFSLTLFLSLQKLPTKTLHICPCILTINF